MTNGLVETDQQREAGKTEEAGARRGAWRPCARRTPRLPGRFGSTPRAFFAYLDTPMTNGLVETDQQREAGKTEIVTSSNTPFTDLPPYGFSPVNSSIFVNSFCTIKQAVS